MSCIEDLLLDETTVTGVVPALNYGVGKALEYVEYNDQDFTKLTGTSFTVTAGFEGSAPQITSMFDLVTAVEKAIPTFFDDCYVFSDRILKLEERLTKLSFTSTGSTYPLKVVVQNDGEKDFVAGIGNASLKVEIKDYFKGFIQPNGYVNYSVIGTVSQTLGTLNAVNRMEFTVLHNTTEDSTKRIFRYANKKQPSNIRVNRVNYSLLPEIQNNLVSGNQGRSYFHFGTYMGMRSISLDLTLIAESAETLRDEIEEFADWIDTRNEEDLKFSDAPDRVWKVRYSGVSEVSENLKVGRFNLNFQCIEPYSYGELVNFSQDVTVEERFIDFKYEGKAESFPMIKLNFTEDADFIDIVPNDGHGNISLGSRKQPVEAPPFNPTPVAGKWAFTTPENWIPMVTYPQDMEGAKFYKTNGVFTTIGGIGMMQKWHYGTFTEDNAWRGAGVYQNFSHQLNDFRAELSPALLGNIHGNISNFGDLVFLDQNGQPFARAQFGFRQFQYALEAYLTSTGVTRNAGSNSLSGKKTWDNFQGKIIVERINNKWRLTVGQYINRNYAPAPESSFDMGTSMLRDVQSTAWVELPRETWGKTVSGIGVILKNFNDRLRLPHFSVRRLVVWELLEEPKVEIKKVIKFTAGDECVIDFQKGQIWLNGTLTPSLLDPSSDWFSLTKGRNILGFNNFTGKATLIYNNMYK